MASTTALLRSQASRQQTIWGQEDTIADYNWSLSDKSLDAFNAYTQHYQDRINNPQADQSKTVSYLNKIKSAQSAYTSNEVQRAAIDIVEGNQPAEYKLQVLGNLYMQAYEAGNYDLAQSLRLQYDNAAVALQNQATASSYAASAAKDKALKQYTDAIKQGMSDLVAGNVPVPGSATLPDGSTLTPASISQYIQNYGVDYADKIIKTAFPDQKSLEDQYGQNATPMDVIYGAVSGYYNSYKDAINQITDPTTKATMMSDLNKQMESDSIDVGGTKMSIASLYQANAYAAENPNNSPFSFQQENGKTKVVLNKPAGHFWQFDADGNFVELPLYAGGTDKSGLRTNYDQTNAAATIAGYKTGEALQYKIGDSGSFELVPASEVRDKNGKITNNATTSRVQNQPGILERIKGVGKGDLTDIAAASYLAPIAGAAAAFGAAGDIVYNALHRSSKPKNQAIQTVDDLLTASGLIKNNDGSYSIDESARADFANNGVTDFSNVSANDIQVAPDGSIQITRRGPQGELQIYAVDKTPRSYDANGNPRIGWVRQQGVDQSMLYNDLVTQPASLLAQYQTNPTTGEYLRNTGNSIAGLNMYNPLQRNQMLLDQLAAEKAIQQNSVNLGSINVPAYNPPAPIAVTPARAVQPAAPARVIQAAAPARVYQPTVNPQPASAGTNVNQLSTSGKVYVDNTSPQYFSLKVQ